MIVPNVNCIIRICIPDRRQQVGGIRCKNNDREIIITINYVSKIMLYISLTILFRYKSNNVIIIIIKFIVMTWIRSNQFCTASKYIYI